MTIKMQVIISSSETRVVIIIVQCYADAGIQGAQHRRFLLILNFNGSILYPTLENRYHSLPYCQTFGRQF